MRDSNPARPLAALAFAFAAALFPMTAPPPAAADPQELRSMLQRSAGRMLPPPASLILSGGGAAVVVAPDWNQAWLLSADGASVADYGEIRVRRDGGGFIVAVLWRGGQPAAASSAAAVRLLRSRPPSGDVHPLYRCQRRVMRGGELQEPAGPFPAGVRLSNGSVTSGGRRIGGWEVAGGDLAAEIEGRKFLLNCAEAETALGDPAPPGVTKAAELAALRAALIEGNAAFDRLIDYQARLRDLAREDAAAARAARLDAGECLAVETLPIICDRLPATFRGAGKRIPHRGAGGIPRRAP